MKKTLLATLALVSIAGAAFADVVYVTGCVSNCTSTATCGNGVNTDVNDLWYPVYADEGGYGAYTSAKAGNTDKVPVPGARYHSTTWSNSTPDMGIVLSPNLAVTGGVYKVWHVYSSLANNVSTNIIIGFTNVEGCTINMTNTDRFQRRFGQPSPQSWQFLGFVTNNADTSYPRVRLYFAGGDVSAGAQARFMIEQFKFEYYEPCTDVPSVAVTGPLGANLNEVVVTGVSASATNITVYQDTGSGMVQIGKKTSGVVAGNNTVTVAGLVKGAQVAATQTINGIDGCTPQQGAIVGTGTNPTVRIALSVRENTALTGPVGTNGSGSVIHFLGASSVLSGGAPEQGVVLQPSTEWQTVTFTPGVDPVYTWNGTPAMSGAWTGPFGALDGLAVACEGDTGPFEIYFDDFANGTNGVFQDFEAVPANTLAFAFAQPSYSGTSIGLLSAPNETRIVSTAAASGTKSLRLRFQYVSELPNNWLRFVTAGNAGWYSSPQLDVNEPISFKVLLLPPGATPTPPANRESQITATVAGGQTVLNWSGPHRLQTSVDVSGTYTNVPQVINGQFTNTFFGPYTNTFTESSRFFRLVD